MRTGGGSIYCNLDAGAGLYLTPDQGLLLYAIEHDNDGPGGSVKFAEFRSARPVPVTEIEAAWIELYDDVHFKDRSVRIDYVDRERKSYHDLNHVERFNDKTSAVRWALPPGWRVRLYEDAAPCGGRYLDFTGTGEQADLRGKDSPTQCRACSGCRRTRILHWLRPRIFPEARGCVLFEER